MNFAETRLSEVRILGILGSSHIRSSTKFALLHSVAVSVCESVGLPSDNTSGKCYDSS